MKTAIAITLSLVSGCLAESFESQEFGETQQAIVNGDPIEQTQAPSAVYFATGKSACSGAWIKENLIMTAAHCFYNNPVPAEDIRIYPGTHPLEDIDPIYALEYVFPSQYEEKDWENDIALIYTEIDPERPANPSEIDTSRDLAVGEQIYAAGFGKEYGTEEGGYPNLNGVNLTVESTGDFLTLRGNDGESICFGDSGGPSYHAGKIVGVNVASYGQCDGGKSLASIPAIHRSWIKKEYSRMFAEYGFQYSDNGCSMNPGKTGSGNGLMLLSLLGLAFLIRKGR
jgi:MYXO-CTERM domain-containing protein